MISIRSKTVGATLLTAMLFAIGACDFSTYADESQACNEPCEDTADCVGGVTCIDMPSGIGQCGGSDPKNCTASTGGSSSGGSSLRGCKSSNGHICSQIVSGDVEAFARQCESDGVPVSSCPSGSILACKGGKATSSGSSVSVDVYWYSAACGAELGKGQKCTNGSQVGTGCK